MHERTRSQSGGRSRRPECTSAPQQTSPKALYCKTKHKYFPSLCLLWPFGASNWHWMSLVRSNVHNYLLGLWWCKFPSFQLTAQKKHLLTGYAQQNETGQCFMSSLFQCNTAIMRACLRLGSFHTHSNLQCCQGTANAHWRFATSCGWQCQANLLFHINLVLGPLLKWTCTNSCVPPKKTHLHACTNK